MEFYVLCIMAAKQKAKRKKERDSLLLSIDVDWLNLARHFLGIQISFMDLALFCSSWARELKIWITMRISAQRGNACLNLGAPTNFLF